MFAKLDAIAARYDELGELLSRPETLADMQEYKKLSRERAETEELVETYRAYRKTEGEMTAALAEAEKETGEMRDMLLEEAQSCRERLAGTEKKAQDAAPAQGPQRREGLYPRDQGGRGRRGGGALCL